MAAINRSPRLCQMIWRGQRPALTYRALSARGALQGDHQVEGGSFTWTTSAEVIVPRDKISCL